MRWLLRWLLLVWRPMVLVWLVLLQDASGLPALPHLLSPRVILGRWIHARRLSKFERSGVVSVGNEEAFLTASVVIPRPSIERGIRLYLLPMLRPRVP